jgi:hypothetical protein
MAKFDGPSGGLGLQGVLSRLESITRFLRYVPGKTLLIPDDGENPVEGHDAQCRTRSVESILKDLVAVEGDLRKIIGTKPVETRKK